MKKLHVLLLGSLISLVLPSWVMAQAIGEYGRSVNGATSRSDRARPGTPGAVGRKGNAGVSQGIAGLDGAALPSRLVVIAEKASLYPRQDEEGEKLAQLVLGDPLVPMMRSASGSTLWYMVKTANGSMGWIKANDVREESVKER